MRFRRIIFFSILIYIMILTSLWTVDNGTLILSIPLVIYLCAVLIYVPRNMHVEINREIGEDIVLPGSTVQITVSIQNHGLSLDEFSIRDVIPEGLRLEEGQMHVLTYLPRDAQFSYTYSVTADRGTYLFNEIQITATDHFGMTLLQRRYEIHQTLTVLPNLERLRSVPIRPLRTRGFAGSIPSRQAGSGTAFFGVREYQPGDPRQWLNWRLSARDIDKLYSNEFEQERIADVGLILDARKRTNVTKGNRSIFEDSIQATASLADMFLRDGNRVGLLIYGRGLERTYPGYGKYQRENIMQALSYAKIGNSMVFDSFDYLPTRFFPAQSQIVIISPLCDADSKILSRIKARGYSLFVVSPDPITFEKKHIPASDSLEIGARIARAQRVLWIRYLQRMGIPVIDWHPDQKLDIALQSAARQLGRGYL